jgi:hypothetical protein
VADNRIGIEFGATGQPQTVAAIQQTGAAVQKANQDAATTAKASGETQIKAAEATSGAMRQAMGIITQYIGVMALMKMAMDGVKGAMADQENATRLNVTLTNIGLGGGKAYDSMIEFAGSLREVYGVADDLTVPALGRLARATGDVAEAQYLAQLAARLSVLTGAEYGSVVSTLVEAEAGRGKGLMALGAEMGIQIDKTGDLHDAYLKLDKATGDSSAVMDTAAARSRKLKVEFDELKEGIFARLMPVMNFGIGVFTELTLVIKETGENLGRMVTFIGQVVPELNVVMNPANWLKPERMKAAYDAIEAYSSNFVGAMKFHAKEFADEWNRINALAQGGGAATGAALALPAGLGVGRGLNGEDGGSDQAAKDDLDREKATRKASHDNYIQHMKAKWDLDRAYSEMLNRDRDKNVQTEEKRMAAFFKHYKAYAGAIGNAMGSTINGLTNLWSDHFRAVSEGQKVQENVWAASGKLVLAMIAKEVQAALQAEAVKYAWKAAAALIAQDYLHAATYGAAALFLGGASVAVGVGAGMITAQPNPKLEPEPEPDKSPGGSYGRNGSGGYSGGGGYGEPRGGQTITNSNVNIYYNPTMVVSGNVYGFDDFRQLVMQFFREYAYIRGMDLAGATGGKG